MKRKNMWERQKKGSFFFPPFPNNSLNLNFKGSMLFNTENEFISYNFILMLTCKNRQHYFLQVVAWNVVKQ
jgi:hypothetical protein